MILNRNCPRTVIFIEGEKTEVKILSRFLEALEIKFEVDISCNDELANSNQKIFFEQSRSNKVFIRRAKCHQIGHFIERESKEIKGSSFPSCIDLSSKFHILDANVMVLLDIDNSKIDEALVVTQNYNSIDRGLCVLSSPMIESIIDSKSSYQGRSTEYKEYLNRETPKLMGAFQDAKKFQSNLKEITQKTLNRDISSTEELLNKFIEFDKYSFDKFNAQIREYFYVYSGVIELLCEMLILDQREVIDLLLEKWKY